MNLPAQPSSGGATIYWFVAAGAELKSPFTEAQLETMIRPGTVTRASLVWCNGMPTWASAESTALVLHFDVPPSQPVARFATILGNHHDNFDLFASSVHARNSTRVGSKCDLVGEFADAARKLQLPWGVSIHPIRAAGWFKPALRADKDRPLKDVPCAGNLTKADARAHAPR